MAIATATAILGAAVIGAGASALSASKASKAANNATAANNAIQQQQFQATQNALNPYIQSGYAPTEALTQRLGLGPIAGGGGSGSVPNALNYQTKGYGGQQAPPGMYFGPNDELLPIPQGASAQGSSAQGGSAQGGGAQGGAVAPAGPRPDYEAYLRDNPDVKANYDQQNSTPEGKAYLASIDYLTPGGPEEDLAAAHYQEFGQKEGRNLVTLPGDPAKPTPAYGQPEDYVTRQANDRPTLANSPDYGDSPGVPTLSFDQYKESDYTKFLRDEGQRNLNANFAARGLLGSGAAGKEAIKFGQDVSGKGYQDWVNNSLALYDRQNSAFNQNRQFNYGEFLNDRNLLNSNFDVDRARQDAVFDADRGYLTGRFDTQTGDLFNLSGRGLGAAQALGGFGQNYATATSANNNNAASVTGNAAIAGANNVNNLLGSALNAYGYYNSSRPAQSVPGYAPNALNPQYAGAANPYRT